MCKPDPKHYTLFGPLNLDYHLDLYIVYGGAPLISLDFEIFRIYKVEPPKCNYRFGAGIFNWAVTITVILHFWTTWIHPQIKHARYATNSSRSENMASVATSATCGITNDAWKCQQGCTNNLVKKRRVIGFAQAVSKQSNTLLVLVIYLVIVMMSPIQHLAPKSPILPKPSIPPTSPWHQLDWLWHQPRHPHWTQLIHPSNQWSL